MNTQRGLPSIFEHNHRALALRAAAVGLIGLSLLPACSNNNSDDRYQSGQTQSTASATPTSRLTSATPATLPTASSSETPKPQVTVSVPGPIVTRKPTASASPVEPSESVSPLVPESETSDQPQQSTQSDAESAAQRQARRSKTATKRITILFAKTCQTVVDAYNNGSADAHDYSPVPPDLRGAGYDTNPTGGRYVSEHVDGSNAVGAVFRGRVIDPENCTAVSVADSSAGFRLETYEASGSTADTTVATIYSRYAAGDGYSDIDTTLRYPTVKIINGNGRQDAKGLTGTTKFDDGPSGYEHPITNDTYQKLAGIELLFDRITSAA